MELIRSFIPGFRALCRKKARNGEIEEELQAYLEDSIEDNIPLYSLRVPGIGPGASGQCFGRGDGVAHPEALR